MSKTRALILILAILFVSCERYCPFCGEYGDCDHCGKKPTLTYNSDRFCAETLMGTWQCGYNTVVGNKTIKMIEFINGKKCDITYSEDKYTDWYTETFIYSYSNQYIRFSKNGVTFSFHLKKYVFPELYVEDSFGTYTWRKIKV